jgi:hypothetical protein
MGFRSLQHSRVRRSTAASVAGARYVPPAGFGYPLGGLRPPSPCRFYFAPAALVGFALRSFLLSEGIRCVSGAEGPTYRLTRRCSRRRIRWAGPAGRGFWAFTLPGVPGDRRGVSATATGCSLGLYPSRVCRRKPGPGSHPDSSHALSRASALQPGPLRSARRVWLPSRRLTPSEPLPGLFRTGGALGIYPSELSPAGRFPRVSARTDPRTVFPAGAPAAEAVGRPSEPRFLGFDPSESPWQPNT